MLKVVRQMTGFASLVGMMAACAPQPGGLGSIGGPGGAESGSDLTSITVGLPDRAPLRAQVSDIETRMNGFHLVIQPVDPNCADATRVNQIADWTVSAILTASLRQGCDYTLSLGLGNKDATSTNALKATYFRNTNLHTISQADIAGKTSVTLDVRVQLQPDGQAIGLRPGQSITLPPINTLPNTLPNTGPNTGPNIGTPNPGPSFPSSKDLNLTSTTGQTKMLSTLVTSDYVLIDFSASTCGPCISAARAINNSASDQKLLDGTKCTGVTLVVNSELRAWTSAVGGFMASHSYGISNLSADSTKLLGSRVTATPTFVLMDRQGTIVERSEGGLPRKFRQLCGAN